MFQEADTDGSGAIEVVFYRQPKPHDRYHCAVRRVPCHLQTSSSWPPGVGWDECTMVPQHCEYICSLSPRWCSPGDSVMRQASPLRLQASIEAANAVCARLVKIVAQPASSRRPTYDRSHVYTHDMIWALHACLVDNPSHDCIPRPAVRPR